MWRSSNPLGARRHVWLPLLVCFGCGDGLTLGISGREGGEPFEATEVNTVPHGVHAVLTAAGTDFFIERRELLARLLLPVDEDGWVRLPLPPFDFGDAGAGLGIGLRGAIAGFDLRTADIELEFLPDPARMRLVVRRARVRLDDAVVWISIGGSAACRLGNGLEPDTPRRHLIEIDIGLDVVPSVDSEGRLGVAVDLLPFTVHALDFTLVYDPELPECADGFTAEECRLTCGLGEAGFELVEAIVAALDNRLNELFAPLVEAAVQYLADNFTETPLFVEGELHPRILAMLVPTAADAHPLGFRVGPSPEGFTLRSAGDDGDGIGLTLDVGLDAVDHPCVPPVGLPPPFEPGEAPALTGYDHTGAPYHLGLSLSDAVLNRAVWTAYRAGALCLALDSATIETLLGQRIDTDTLALVLPGLRELTGGPRPIRIALDVAFQPSDFPLATFFEVADDGGIPQAGVALDLPNVGISFYALIEERWSRLFSARVGIAVEVTVQATPDNELALMLGPPTVDGLVVDYNELLEGANVPEMLEVVVSVLTAFLGSGDFTLNLGVDELLTQFTDLPLGVDIAGLQTQGERGDFLSVLMSLRGVADRGARGAVETRAQLVAFDGWTATLQVDAGTAARFQWRVDRGPWRPLVRAPGGTLTVRDPLLRPDTPHELAIRAVEEHDYRTLDPTPAVVTIVLRKPGQPTARGCASGPAPLFVLLLLVAWRRRVQRTRAA